MVLGELVPSINWNTIIFYIQIALIILIFVFFLLAIIYYFSWRIRGIIIKRRAGGILRGFRTWGKHVRKEEGRINQIKILRRRQLERRPPQTAMIALGRKDFIIWHEDDASDLKPFKIHIDRGIVKKAIQAAIKRTENKSKENPEINQETYLTSLLLNYFCPSLNVDNVDMRRWKVLQDKATESAYKKIEKWKDILYIGGFVVMVVMFIVGIVLMKSVC